jgi:uncharacterized secreted protein with C-terminal beta-propeller domain
MGKGKVVILTALISLSTFIMLCTDIKYDAAALNRFKSYAELKLFLQRSPYFNDKPPALFPETQMPGFRAMFLSAARCPSYSTTNIQVEGVDEADIVKTDGEHLYIISGQCVVIMKAYPPSEAAILSRITVNGTLKQLFINGNRLVIFYQEGYWDNAKTFIQVYDVSQKESPMLRREVIVEGGYFNSRMINNYAYVIIMRSANIVNDEVRLPRICSEGRWKEIPATEIYYSEMPDYGYLFTTIVAIDVQNDKREPAYKEILLGAKTCMYVSLNNIYLAIRAYNKTYLYRIHIKEDEIICAAYGQVSGVVLNQFSMDEYNGHFRIATSYAGRNNLYVLNMDLEVVGSLEDIALKEFIYSARFMGDICYLVTFKKVDPFFVIDLTDPYKPRVLGELKISGYSSYLHPYGRNYVIGIGKETIPSDVGDFAWYQGVKISLFDVSNVYDPKEVSRYIIGDRGTDSPVLEDHKALLLDEEKGLLILPVLVAERPEDAPPNVHGKPVWQGVYVFTISTWPEGKITLKGTITHIENGNITDRTHYIIRAVYIGDFLYTISKEMVKINSLSDLSEIRKLDIKTEG